MLVETNIKFFISSEAISLGKMNIPLILIISISLSLPAFSFIDDVPNASASGPWENVLSESKTVAIPPGQEYFLHFNQSSGTLSEMLLPAIEAGLSQKAKDALSQVPPWLYNDLAMKFVELGDTNINVVDFATPIFADMDADGDFDLSAGSGTGPLWYYENVGTIYRPIFRSDTNIYSSINEDHLQGVSKTTMAIADLDADGDNDLHVGNSDGDIIIFENIGSPEQAVWNFSAWGNGFTESNSAPEFVDLDDDEDFDVAIGSGDGNIYFYENIGSPQSPLWTYSYTLNTGEDDDRIPSFEDMDDDGDFDMTVGDGDFATLYYYQNIGSSTQEIWLEDATMYSGVAPEYGTSPATADINCDERPDLVVGCQSGRLFYFRNTGSASNAQWLIWSSYQVVEGFNYYPKDVLLDYRSDYWMDLYADLILDSAQKYKDEIAFAIAHTPTENLKALNQNQAQLFVDNAELIYEIDQHLDYVELIEMEDYTTTRYQFGEPWNPQYRELPKDIYYWFIVHPKITDENVMYIHPDDSDPNHPTDPEQGGRFWREYLFFHADDSYPADNSGSPDDGVDDYPQDISPPLLKDALAGIKTLWNGTSHSAPAGRSIDYGENALIRVSNWVGWTLFLNQQEVSDDERPIQPVRIAHHHNGNCGELQDLTTSTARTALIPAAGVNLLGEDHVWIEFFENGWHQWDNYWSHAGSVIDNFDNYWVGWGQRGGSGILKQGGDDDAWEVTDHYIPEEHLNYVTIKVMDNNGDPVDGARVLAFSYWLKVNIEGYQIEIPFPCIWNYTDSNGETLFKLATQEKDNGNKNFTFKIISKVGSTESGKIELEHGQDYTFEFNLEGSAPNPELNTFSLPNPNPPDPEYRFGLNYQVRTGIQNPPNMLTGNRHLEEIPPERIPEPKSDDFQGNHIDSFVADEQGFRDYMKGQYFDSYEYAQDSNSDSFEFDLPDNGDWYIVLSNRDSIETTKVVDLTFYLSYSPRPYSVRINDPISGSQVNLGGIITISGMVSDEDELQSLRLSYDDGNSWSYLGSSDNNWIYYWNTNSLDSGTYTIEVVAEFQSSQDSHTIEIRLSDLELPELEILNPEGYSRYNIGETISIQGTAFDNIIVESLQISLDGGNNWTDITMNLNNGQWTYEWETTGFAMDYYVIHVMATDGTNRRLISSWDGIELSDTYPPEISISTPINYDKFDIGTIITINGTAMDNFDVTGLHLSIDGGQNWTDILWALRDDVWSYEWDTEGLSLGSRVLVVNASDGFNYATFSVEIELVDSQGPLISIDYPEKDSKINCGSQVTIFGKARDNVEIMELKLSTDGGKIWVDILWSLSDGKWSYEWDTQGYSPGMSVIKLRASDGEHQESVYKQVELIDSVVPELSITSPLQNEEIICGNTITITGTAYDNIGIIELELSTDYGNTWINIFPSLEDGNWQYDWDTQGLAGGKHTISVATSDGVNPRVTESVSINLMDMEEPELEIITPIWDFEYDVGDIVLFEGRATDNVQVSELDISFDNGATWTDIHEEMDSRGRWSYMWETSHLEPGTYDVRIRTSDGTNEVEDSLAIILLETDTEDEGKSISFSQIWWLLLISVVLILVVATSAIMLRRRRRKRNVVVVEEIR
jgi:hypothetical protein